jgi:L-threonylcarbamoyladenylate synthase
MSNNECPAFAGSTVGTADSPVAAGDHALWRGDSRPHGGVVPQKPFWKVGPRMGEDEAIGDAATVIRNGGVIIYPTETFYGLGGHPGQVAAIEKIYCIKGRDSRKPLPLIAADVAFARAAAEEWPTAAEKLANAFWPGPLTLILTAVRPPASSSAPVSCEMLAPAVHAGTGKIAVRVSSHPIARALSSLVGGFLIATSANFSGQPPCMDAREIPAPLFAAVDGVLDAGVLPGVLPSTIVDVSSGPPRLVRAGCLSWERVRSTL